MSVIISKGLYDELTKLIEKKKPRLIEDLELMYINHAKRHIKKPLTRVQIKAIKRHVRNLLEGK